MSYKYDPVNKILIKTKEAKDSDPIAALQNFKKHAEYGDSFKLDIKGKKAMVQKEADGWYISYEGRKEKGPYKIIEAAVKEFMKDSKTVDGKVYSVGYKSNGVYQSIGVRADSPEEAMRKAGDHFNAKGKKVELLGASIGESENTMRMKGKPIIDKKTVDYSYQDASKVFSYLDKEVQRDLINYTKTLQSADTPKKCEELEQIIRDLMEDYMDEYLGIWNQVGQYAQDKRKQTQQLFSTLMAQCFKKYSELKRAGK